MATKLEKDITRESTVLIDDKEIMVTLTSDQKVSMKLKGKRSGGVSIGIDELYGQLTGNPINVDDNVEKNKKGLTIPQSTEKPTKKNPMILLSDLRSQNAISGGDYKHVAHFDMIIKNLMDNM